MESKNNLNFQDLMEINGGVGYDEMADTIVCTGAFAKAVVCKKGASAVSTGTDTGTSTSN